MATKGVPNTIQFDDVTNLTTFIVNYAQAHGMPLPGRVCGHRDKVMVLPSDITKAHVFTTYKEAKFGLLLVDLNFTMFGRVFCHTFQLASLPLISVSCVNRTV